ncbi:hypothetical protein IJG72_07815 [bacterium]|nr:hypothetical protein [bacterium]
MRTGLSTSNFTNKKIDNTSVDSVKNVIFQRAMTKASGTAEAISKSENVYDTVSIRSDFQDDVMKEARDTVGKGVNPFSGGVFKPQDNKTSVLNNVNKAQSNKNNDKTNSPKIVGKSGVSDIEMFSTAMKENVMDEAREQVTSKDTLMSRLQFLNTQNAIKNYPQSRFL